MHSYRGKSLRLPSCLASGEYFAVVTDLQERGVSVSGRTKTARRAPRMGFARGGGPTGRRDGLKSHCPSGRVGSSPTRRIKPSITGARPVPSRYDYGPMAKTVGMLTGGGD